MKLKNGYTLHWEEIPDSATCGNGGSVVVRLLYGGKLVQEFSTCPCGRGCYGRDCVEDRWGYHDTALEEFREDE